MQEEKDIQVKLEAHVKALVDQLNQYKPDAKFKPGDKARLLGEIKNKVMAVMGEEGLGNRVYRQAGGFDAEIAFAYLLEALALCSIDRYASDTGIKSIQDLSDHLDVQRQRGQPEGLAEISCTEMLKALTQQHLTCQLLTAWGPLPDNTETQKHRANIEKLQQQIAAIQAEFTTLLLSYKDKGDSKKEDKGDKKKHKPEHKPDAFLFALTRLGEFFLALYPGVDPQRLNPLFSRLRSYFKERSAEVSVVQPADDAKAAGQKFESFKVDALAKARQIIETVKPLVAEAKQAEAVSPEALQEISRRFLVPADTAIERLEELGGSNKIDGFKGIRKQLEAAAAALDPSRGSVCSEAERTPLLKQLKAVSADLLKEIRQEQDNQEALQKDKIKLDIVAAARLALKRLPSATPAQEAAQVGVMCFEKLFFDTSEQVVKDAKQPAPEDSPFLDKFSPIVDALGKEDKEVKEDQKIPKRADFQKLIESIADHSEAFRTLPQKVAGKKLVNDLQKLLNEFFIDKDAFLKTHKKALERQGYPQNQTHPLLLIFVKAITSAELSLSVPVQPFREWSRLLHHSSSGFRFDITAGMRELLKAIATYGAAKEEEVEAKAVGREEAMPGSKMEADAKAAAAAMTPEKEKAAERVGAAKKDVLEALTMQWWQLEAQWQELAKGVPLNPELLVTRLAEVLPDDYPFYFIRLQGFNLFCEEDLPFEEVGTAIVSFGQALTLKTTRQAIVRSLPPAEAKVADAKIDLDHRFADVDKLRLYKGRMQTFLAQLPLAAESSFGTKMAAFALYCVEMGECLEKLYQGLTPDNVTQKLPILPEIQARRPFSPEEFVDKRNAIAAVRSAILALSPDNPIRPHALLGVLGYDHLLNNQPLSVEVVPDDDARKVSAQKFLGTLQRTNAERLKFEAVIDAITRDVTPLQDLFQRVQQQELVYALRVKLEECLCDPKFSGDFSKLKASFRDKIKEIAPPLLFEKWSALFLAQLAPIVLPNEAKEAKSDNLSSNLALGGQPGGPTILLEPVTPVVDDLKLPAAERVLDRKAVAAIKPLNTTKRSNILTEWLSSFVTYIGGPTFRASLFLMIAFALFGVSYLAVAEGFLSGTIAIAPILAAIGLAAVANSVVHWVKSNAVEEMPGCQILAWRQEAEDIVKRYHLPGVSQEMHDMWNAGLLAYLKNVHKFLELPLANNPWQPAIVKYGHVAQAAAINEGELGRDNYDLSEIIKSLEQKKSLDPAQASNLERIFRHIHTLKIDPTFRPNPRWYTIAFFTLLAIASLSACVAVLTLIFTGGIDIAVTNIPWAMSLAAGLGFLSWLSAKYVINKTAGGVYTQWTALFVVFLVTFAVLAIFGIVSKPVWALFTLLTISSTAAAIYHGHEDEPEQRESNRKSFYYRFCAGLLAVVKFALIVGFLMLAFFSLALLFNLTQLGPFNGLMDFATNIIIEMAGIGGLEAGAQWLGAFCVAIFAASSFFAFELFQNMGKRSPASARDIDIPQRPVIQRAPTILSWIAHGFKMALYQFRMLRYHGITPTLFKLLFTVAIIFTMIGVAESGGLIAGSQIVLWPIYLIIALVMPIMSGNVNFNLLPRSVKEFFNSWFGLNPLKNDSAQGYHHFWKELRVMMVLALFLLFALLPGVPTDTGLMLLGIGAAITMGFRWFTLLWNAYVDPTKQVSAYFESSFQKAITKLEDNLTFPPNAATVAMGIRYYPKQKINRFIDNTFGHTQVFFRFYDKDGHEVHEIIVDWNNGEPFYTDRGNVTLHDEPSIEIMSTKSPAAVFKNQIHEYIEKHLDHNLRLFDGKSYDATSHNCAHVALMVVKKYLETAGSLSDAQKARLDGLLARKGAPILTPYAMVHDVMGILLDNLKQKSGTPIEILQAQIVELDLKIADKQAEEWTTKPQNTLAIQILQREKIKLEKELQQALQKAADLAPRAIELSVPQKPAAAIPVQPEPLFPPDNAAIDAGGRIGVLEQKGGSPQLVDVSLSLGSARESKRPVPDGISRDLSILGFLAGDQFIPPATLLTADARNVLIAQQMDRSDSLSSVGVEHSASLPEAKSSVGFLGSRSAAKSLVGVPVGFAVKTPSWFLFVFKQARQFILSVVVISMLVAMSLLHVISAVTLIYLIAAAAFVVSYLFSKQQFFTAMETVWQLMAAKGRDLNTADKSFLLQFVDSAILAMERELKAKDKNKQGVILWGGEQGVSRKFLSDLVALQSIKERLIQGGALDDSDFNNDPNSFINICQRLKTCEVADHNPWRNQILILFTLVCLTVGIMVPGLFALNIGHFAASSSTQVVTWLVAGLSLSLLVIKGLMEWARSHAVSYDELTGKVRRPSQRMTVERAMIWMSNLALVLLTVIVGFLLGVTSTGFYMLVGVTALWGLGQALASSTLLSWIMGRAPVVSGVKTVELPPRAAVELEISPLVSVEAKRAPAVEQMSLGGQDNGILPGVSDGKKNQLERGLLSIGSEAKITPPAKPNVPYFTTNAKTKLAKASTTTTFFLRSYFLVATIFGYRDHPAYSNTFFYMFWNLLNSGATGLEAYQSKWQDASESEKRLLVFEVTTASFLFVTNIISFTAELVNSNDATLKALSGYGFAAGLTADTFRALNDLMIAWDHCSPRALVDERLKKYRMADGAEKKQLGNEILALVRVKGSSDLLELNESLETYLPKELFASLQQSPAPTGEEMLFVETLFQVNEKKLKDAVIAFVGCLTAALAFWLLALYPSSQFFTGVNAFGNLDNFGGGVNIFFVIAGLVNFLQWGYTASSGIRAVSDDQLREKFLADHAKEINHFIVTDETPAAMVEVHWFPEFFEDKKITDPNAMANYKMAYYLRKQELLKGVDEKTLSTVGKEKVLAFLNAIHTEQPDPSKNLQLKAALDEFIVLAAAKSANEDKVKNNFFTELLKDLVTPKQADSRLDLFRHHPKERTKRATATLKASFFNQPAAQAGSPASPKPLSPASASDQKSPRPPEPDPSGAVEVRSPKS